jgi:hypothetical protein
LPLSLREPVEVQELVVPCREAAEQSEMESDQNRGNAAMTHRIVEI